MEFNMDERIVAIGGGTGLSTMLKGLKLHTHNVTAVVTVADDGGSSGVLRTDYGMLPPGDVRNCVSALADVDPELGEILNFRFKEGTLSGHSLGNIILAAINELSPTFETAVKRFCKMAGVVGRVYPVTNENVVLSAMLSDGTVITGESNIGRHRSNQPIDHVFLTPEANAIEDVIKAIERAQIIVLGPGSLYTSIIPNLLVGGVVDAIHKSSAVKIYVCNLMEQEGETEGYSVNDHLEAIEKHSYRGIADTVIANSAEVPEELKQKYSLQYAHPVRVDAEKVMTRSNLMLGNLMLIQDGQVRHNFSRLSRVIMNAYRSRA